MLRLLTDGAIDVPDGWDQEYGIQVIPINIHFGEKTYIQNVDMNLDSFYKEIGVNKNHPKTSQPSPHQFVEYIRANFQKGESILSIHVTSKLSGTYASCVAAAEELKGEYNLIPFDSLSGSVGGAFMCRTAARMAKAGKGADEIVKKLESLRAQTQVILTLDSLEFAKRSGRVGTLKAALASVLNVKPIAVLKEGVLEMVERARTRKAAIARTAEMGRELVGDAPVVIGAVHAHDLESAKLMLEEAKKTLNVKESVFAELSVSLAINLGPGTVGLVIYPAE
ncbi:MAG: Protein DegV [Anaerolineales bacterium]|nr:Protein DegV [Anaerolineales bacterium]